jgi:2-polyprenyl-3-methyl-5-hydroxy-6-metoxy-1,4-benzoquinol methylase
VAKAQCIPDYEVFYLMPIYDPRMIEAHFDKAGDEEWWRLDKTPRGKVQLHIHQHYLQKYIHKGDRILEIGPGPGRFTIELARLGARIGVVDISQEQLKLNETRLKEAGLEESIEWRKKLDIIHLDGIRSDSFDSVVCYGGPLSYVLDCIDEALEEVIRVTKPRGHILASVMSCLGTYHHLIQSVFEDVEEGMFSVGELDDLTRTGDVIGRLAAEGTHQCHMFRWSELREVLGGHPVDILEASAANFLTNGVARQETLSKIMKDPEKWNTLLKWGLDFSREPGAIDGGTHMIVVLRKQT